MCGRYVRRGSKQKIAEYFHANTNHLELPMPGADYNVAPTTFQSIIRQNRDTGDREMILARWGLVPFFTKALEEVKGISIINARAESITKAPTWREPMKKRRCIIPATDSMNGCDLKVVPMIVRRVTRPDLPSHRQYPRRSSGAVTLR